MSRPKNGVTAENFLQVDRYFTRALKYDRLTSQNWFNNFDELYNAKNAFLKLPAINLSNIKKNNERIEALQKWIDKYITPNKWQRCLLTLRQNKSRKKLKLRQLNLRSDIYLTIKMLARKQGITMGEALKKLAEPALNKIYKSEFSKELKIKESRLHKLSI